MFSKTKEEESCMALNCEENKVEDNAEDIFLTEEIEIEEMAIDGICGVY